MDNETSAPSWGRWRSRSTTVACAVLLAVISLFAWHEVRDAAAGPDATEPSCAWAAHIEHANSDQAALIRCYLSAIAHHSASELRSVVRSTDNNGPTGFSASDFSHSADARSGQSAVTVIPNDTDSADATVSIRYADGSHQNCEIHIANPTKNSAHSWRFWSVGTYPHDPNTPHPAVS